MQVPNKIGIILICIIMYNAIYNIPSKEITSTIYVDDDNTEGPWDGTQEYPYQFIQDAIETAKNRNSIIVYEGYYKENIDINKPLNLIGSDPFFTIIDGMQKDSTVIITANNCTFKGFQVINCSFEYLVFEKSLLQIESDNNFIQNNLFSLHATNDFLTIASLQVNNGDNNHIISNMFISKQNTSRNHAIFLNNTCSNTLIEENQITGFDSGITDTIHSLNTQFKKNDIYENVFGLELYGSNNSIRYNNISFNTATGIIFYGGTNTIISRNLFEENGHNNGVGGAPGIMIYNGAGSLKIIRNEFLNNAGPGVYIHTSFNNKISKNNFVNNGWNYNHDRKPNAFFYTHIMKIFQTNDWDGNYWEPSSYPLITFIPSELRIFSYFDFVYSIPWFAFDKDPARESYIIYNDA